MSAARRLGALGAALAVAGAAMAGCEARRPPSPNVLVVVIDTLRPDRLGCYGHDRDTSPTIDALAAEGVLFEQTLSVAPRTWQSFTSILTGLYPPRHGVRVIFDKPLGEVPTLASVLRGRGYRTAAFDGIPFLRGMTGGKAFEEYVDSQTTGSMLGDHQLVDELLAWSGLTDGRPFFAFLRFGAPHWPYACEDHFHEEGAPHPAELHVFNQGSQGLAMGRGQGAGMVVDDSHAYRKLMYGKHPPAVDAHMRLHYDECVRTSDRAVGRVVARLRDLGTLDRTLIVVTSDHGESFGEYGYNTHGPQVDDPVMLVPLVVRFPAGAPPTRRGARVVQLVRTVDITPTVLDLLGMPVPADLDGVSLRAAIDQGTDLELTAYGESGEGFVGIDPDLKLPGVAGKLRMLRTPRWKLVHVPDEDGGTDRLFDLTSEARESADVSPAHPDVVASLRRQLDEVMAKDARGADWKSPTLSEEQKERLRQLGYL